MEVLGLGQVLAAEELAADFAARDLQARPKGNKRAESPKLQMGQHFAQAKSIAETKLQTRIEKYMCRSNDY